MPNKLDLNKVERESLKDYWSEKAAIYDNTIFELKNMNFFGDSFKGDFTVNLNAYNRSTTFNVHALGVTMANDQFQQPYSGFIGLAPYAALSEQDK